MYAVIKTGGKQYRVAAGEKLKIEQIPADIGAEITIDQVLAVGSGDQLSVGAPLVDGATVSATVLAQGRHDKIRIFKMRRRKHYRKTLGHRQPYTEIFISRIASALGTAEAESAAPVPSAAPAGDKAASAGDDLTRIEGIGPKIAEEVLGKNGIRSFADLAGTSVERLRELLAEAGSRFAAHDPGTWPEQAALAAKGDFEGLDKLKAELDGGKRA